MRKLVTIRTIEALEPIPKKDKICVALIGGWTCIVNKSDFQVGDKCVYCEPDTLLPPKPEFEFLRSRCWKESWNGHLVSKMKMAGVVSYGIVFPLSILEDKKKTRTDGDDITDELCARKYDPEALAEQLIARPTTWFTKAMNWKIFRFFHAIYRKIVPKANKGWPSFVSKTDEDRVQNCSVLLRQFKGTRCYTTEKIEGQSATFAYNKKHFYVCSRNVRKFTKDSSNYWQVAIKYDLEKKLKALSQEYKADITIQGEIAGPGVQGNIYKFNGLRFFIFNVWLDGVNVTSTFKIKEFALALDVDHVPILNDAIYDLPDNAAAILKEATIKSTLKNDIWAEGIVVRAANGKFSFKAINPEYKSPNLE